MGKVGKYRQNEVFAVFWQRYNVFRMQYNGMSIFILGKLKSYTCPHCKRSFSTTIQDGVTECPTCHRKLTMTQNTPLFHS
jgi:DNA-directed RNA polymerase subunit RPC12/RpoP